VLPAAAQDVLKGNWQGLMIRDGQSPDQATIVYFDFTDNGDFIGKSREEVTGKDAFIVKKLKGTKQSKTVQLKQFVADKKKEIPGVKWCNIEATLTFVDSTGYLEGSYKSSECRGYSGKIICYRSSLPLSYEPTVKEVQSWRPIFADDLKKGRKAPEIRDFERKNFRFQPIYFDHDKAEIRPEFKNFLISMVQVTQTPTARMLTISISRSDVHRRSSISSLPWGCRVTAFRLNFAAKRSPSGIIPLPRENSSTAAWISRLSDPD
jgi:hypothetical protein